MIGWIRRMATNRHCKVEVNVAGGTTLTGYSADDVIRIMTALTTMSSDAARWSAS